MYRMSKKLINVLVFNLLFFIVPFQSISQTSEKVDKVQIENWIENIPILNMLPGVKSKLALGSWFKVFYVMLKNMKFLRGTPFDFMAWFSSDVRKADKKALNHYKSILEKNINEIGNGKYQDLKEFSSLPDIIRGYEEVRLDTMTEYYKKSDNLFKA